MVRVTNDPGVIVRAALLVPELELLDTQHVPAETPSEPVERTTADTTQPDDDRLVVGRRLIGHERCSWYSTADIALLPFERHSRFAPTGLPSTSAMART